jgi:ribose 5-phosphate isomerase B
MTIFIGADHRGFNLKSQIKDWLISSGHHVEDLGALEHMLRDDYTDYAEAVARKVSGEQGSRGILICGSGAGVNIAANKINGIRSVLGFNVEQVKAARNDDNVNILSLASDYTLPDDAKILVETFLQSAYDPTDNHARRIEKIKILEQN